jgi:Cu+-exporting ATPase
MHAPATVTERETLTLPVLGMTCASCQRHVEQALRSAAGVDEARVDLMAHRASVVFDPAVARPEALVEAVRRAGYDAVLPRRDFERAERAADPSRRAWAALVAGALAMVFSMPLGMQPGAAMSLPDRLLMRAAPWLYALPANGLRWALLVLTAVIAVWAGRGIYLSAARGLRHGTTNMNTLVSLGTAVAFAYSAYATISPAPGRQVYYDAVLLILGFLLLGKALEARAKHRALSAVDALSKLRPATARRVAGGVQTVVPLEEIRPGDCVAVLPGERFPVDAVIVEGRTTVDESMLTGEAAPQEREPGGRVLAGSLNYDGAVTCRAESLGEATVIAQIARMAEQAQSSRAPMERLADRVSAVFVPVVLALAAITFAGWLVASRSLALALENTVAVLVIACPCAMGLAVPAALTVAVGRGAQLGVLFKGGEALERLTKLDVIVLDKTGTLTVGRPVLESIHPIEGLGTRDVGTEGLGTEGVREPGFPFRASSFERPLFEGREATRSIEGVLPGAPGLASETWETTELLRLAASAEERSNHPLGHAIIEAARARGIAWKPAEEVQAIPGRGLTARVEAQEVMLGNEALFGEFFVKLPENTKPVGAGVTRLWMAIDNKAAGYFDARDALRPDAVAAVAALKAEGLRVVMLTGDSAEAAAPIANEAGISEVEAGLDPAGKLARIRALQQRGLRVAMVGDGINDAAALAQADAGIAMAAGADLAQEAGDVLLLRTRPSAIPLALGLARQTLRVMRQNLGWAAGYNLLGIPLAAGLLYPAFHILLTPWLAAAAMAFSSVCVLTNSLRLRRWQAEGRNGPEGRAKL